MALYLGATGTGKSTAVRAALDATKSAPGWWIIVDPDNIDYTHLALRCTSLGELVQRVQGPSGRLRFVPSDDRKTAEQQFNFLCAIVWKIAERGRPATLVVDELSEYTTASSAPFWWKRLVKRGRKKGITIYAASQRPAEIDKTIFSNASLVRTGRLNFPDDRVVVAAALGVSVSDVGQLGQLDYLERDYNSGELRRGRLTF